MNKNIILLIGMPGCGKTTIGKEVASYLSYSFCDMDDYIEEISKSSIKDLFEKGEDYFRDYETKACSILSNINENIIISSGGGVVKRKENIDFFDEKGIIIFIDRPIDNILSDVDVDTRPLLKEGRDKLYNLYLERYNLYKDYCHYRIANDDSIEEVVKSIIKIIENIK